MRRSLHLYFRLAFGITWGVGGLGLLLAAGFKHPFTTGSSLYFLAGYGPTLAGLLVAAWSGGGLAVRRLLGSGVPRRSSVAWYPAVLIGYPALLLAVGRWLPPPPGAPSIPWTSLPSLLPAALLTDTGPLGEELGWRGFALPNLLIRRSPLAAGLIVGLFWAAWHLPTFFVAKLPQSHFSIPLFCGSIVALSVAMTGLYKASGKALDLMVLLHLVTNFWASYVSAEARLVSHSLLAVVAVPAARMWLRTPSTNAPFDDPLPPTLERLG